MPTGISLYNWRESAEIIGQSKCFAKAMLRAVFPTPVGPDKTISRGVYTTFSGLKEGL